MPSFREKIPAVMPQTIAAKAAEANNINPAFLLFNIPVPTAVMIKPAPPQKLKRIILDASLLLILLLS